MLSAEREKGCTLLETAVWRRLAARACPLAVLLLVLAALTPVPAPAAPRPAATCQDSPLPSGALARVCLPASVWAGDVLIYVPGFSPSGGFRNLVLPDGTELADVVNRAGMAFATTNVGLVVDVRELAEALPSLLGRAPRRVMIAGVSQGGLVTTLLAEQEPQRFSAALALCGPIGDYRGQIDYFGDYRALFDYFFPGVLPGDAVAIPQPLIDGWESTYAPAVAAAVAADPAAAAELIAVSGAAIDTTTPAIAATTTLSTTLGALWYNVFATNGARAELGGNPYENQGRAYAGSSDDAMLNQGVGRYTADLQALAALTASETSGQIRIPLVLMHTTGDEIVPFWHVERYLAKVRRVGLDANVTFFPAARYGHCNFTSDELLTSFIVLNQQAEARLRVFLPAVGR
ncbi:MAG: hypothetical protein RLZZ387_984 [Chloroflexota bacterium]